MLETDKTGEKMIKLQNDLKALEIQDETLNNDQIEQIWCQIVTSEESVLIGCIYRPPHSDRSVNLNIIKSYFNLYFDLTNDFEDLNDDWDFISQSANKIELLDVSGGSGETDYLTFEKN